MMAIISVARVSDLYRVVITGCLEAQDLKCLELACAEALQHEGVPLELSVERVTSIDEGARAYLEHLRTRGASVCGVLIARASMDDW
jgi:hypothetical protein